MLRSSASRLSTRLSAKPAIRALSVAHIRPLASIPLAQRQIQPRSHASTRHFSASAPHSAFLTKLCPQCSKPLPTPLPACPNCDYIARLSPSTSFFDILGVPYSQSPFEVDVALLKNRFRDLQRVIHPDKWSGKGEVSHNFLLHRSVTELMCTFLDRTSFSSGDLEPCQ